VAPPPCLWFAYAHIKTPSRQHRAHHYHAAPTFSDTFSATKLRRRSARHHARAYAATPAQELVTFLRESQFFDDLTRTVSAELLTLNDALKVIGYARVSLEAAPWGVYSGAATLLQLPLRLYALSRAGLLRAANDAALLAAVAGFLWETWSPLHSVAVGWLGNAWRARRLRRRRVRLQTRPFFPPFVLLVLRSDRRLQFLHARLREGAPLSHCNCCLHVTEAGAGPPVDSGCFDNWLHRKFIACSTRPDNGWIPLPIVLGKLLSAASSASTCE
jgi:hypothetical protein